MSKIIEETQAVVDEMLDSQMESLLKQKQELEEEMDLYEEDDVQYVQAELDEVNEKISKLSKVDSFNIVDEMYSEDDDTPFLTNDIFES